MMLVSAQRMLAGSRILPGSYYNVPIAIGFAKDRPAAVKDFAAQFARDVTAFEIDDHQIFRRQHAFIHARRGRQDALIVEPHRQIAFARDNVAALVHPAPGDTQIDAMLLLCFC